jgi:hypothetical protein
MKKLKSIALGICLFSTALFTVSCGSTSTSDNAHETGKEYTSAYVCPMHCTDSGAAEMGTCPVCKMDYVARDKHIEGGHTH